MTFSQSVKSELKKIREVGKECKEALAYGLDYGLKQGSSVENLIIDRVLGADAESGISGIFLRGVFLSCGSISDPNKVYHLELTLPNNEKCREMLEFLEEHNLKMKLSRRTVQKNGKSVEQSFLYCKEREQIADFLTCIGAVNHSMNLMNVMIIKDLRNTVNRAVNCDTANIKKAAETSSKQVSDIKFILDIEKKTGKTILKEPLRHLAKIRCNNEGMPLSYIGNLLEPPISKSGVNHRLKKINDIAEKLRNSEIL